MSDDISPVSTDDQLSLQVGDTVRTVIQDFGDELQYARDEILDS